MTNNRSQRFKDSRRPSLPVGYLNKGYFDKDGHLFPELIQDWAKDISDALFAARPRMTTNQLKGAFFSQVRRLERRLDIISDFDAVRPDILKLNVYAVDRRKKNKVSNLFEDFIRENVKKINNKKDFKEGFVVHFESIVGLYPDVRGN